MPNAFDRLKTFWNEHPVESILLGAFALTATAKVIDSVNNTRNSRTWAKEVNRRDRMT